MPAKVQNTSVTAPRQQKNDVRPSGGINPIRRYSVTNRLSRISFMFFRILMRYVITLDIPIQMIQVGQQRHFYKRFYVLKMVANFGDFFSFTCFTLSCSLFRNNKLIPGPFAPAHFTCLLPTQGIR